MRQVVIATSLDNTSIDGVWPMPLRFLVIYCMTVIFLIFVVVELFFLSLELVVQILEEPKKLWQNL